MTGNVRKVYKYVSEDKLFVIEYKRRLGSGEGTSSTTWTGTTGLTFASESASGTHAQCIVSGGNENQKEIVKVSTTTTGGQNIVTFLELFVLPEPI